MNGILELKPLNAYSLPNDHITGPICMIYEVWNFFKFLPKDVLYMNSKRAFILSET